MSKRHIWTMPDEAGIRACMKEGCTVRTKDHYREWQPKKGMLWRSWLREHLPDCYGKEPT